MQSAFYRMALAPNIMYIEQLFNHILDDNGYPEIRFKLQFPNESIDPQKEEEKQTSRFVGGIVTRDEARQSLSLQPLGGTQIVLGLEVLPSARIGLAGSYSISDGHAVVDLGDEQGPGRVEHRRNPLSPNRHRNVDRRTLSFHALTEQ